MFLNIEEINTHTNVKRSMNQLYLSSNASDKSSFANNLVLMETQQEALTQSYADASTSGARVFLCHIYQQGGRNHLVFSLPCNLLLELGKLQSAETKKNKSNAEEKINRPLMRPHVNEIAKYLINTPNYVLPPFIFNCSTPIKVFAYGTGAVKFGYAVIPSNVELYVTDGQHRLKAIEKAMEERPSLKNDSVTVLVIEEDDIDQIHQDFADCAKTKPIPPALLAAFDVSNVLSKLSRKISRESIIFADRIDKISRTVGKDPNYLFTMSQLRIGMAEFLFGSSRKQVIESRSNQEDCEWEALLDRAKYFYLTFAENNGTWQQLLKPQSQTINLDLYTLRQERVDFNSVGFQVISRVGHHIFFGKEFTDMERNNLIQALAAIDYRRDAELWNNALVIDDGKGGKKIVAQIAAINKGFRLAVEEVEKATNLSLNCLKK